MPISWSSNSRCCSKKVFSNVAGAPVVDDAVGLFVLDDIFELCLGRREGSPDRGGIKTRDSLDQVRANTDCQSFPLPFESRAVNTTALRHVMMHAMMHRCGSHSLGSYCYSVFTNNCLSLIYVVQ